MKRKLGKHRVPETWYLRMVSSFMLNGKQFKHGGVAGSDGMKTPDKIS